MKSNLSILVIDDDKFHLDILVSKLKSLKYSNLRLANTYNEDISSLMESLPDIIITDYYLDHNKTALDIFKNVNVSFPTPIIIISSYFNHEVLDQIKEIHPIDFLSKNVSEFELDKTIMLSCNKLEKIAKNSPLHEFVLVKTGKFLKKITIDQIEYISVYGKYLKIISEATPYLVRSSLNDFAAKLPENFIKIHQSYIININFVQSINVDENMVNLKTIQIPFARAFKKLLLSKYYIP
ncbi:MAG TPA: response regulator transcription factor [Saprospiraceae bacterium]|nr:response regulator transcription factor [Saprospiraceae bacterium]